MAVTEAELEALVGHRFAGGRYRIAHWENFLLTEATGRPPMPDDLAHPVHLFHVPIAAAGTSLAELFELGHAESDASITIDYYDWEIFAPLRENESYLGRGGIVDHERSRPGGSATVDSIGFELELLRGDGALAARVRFRWHFWSWAP